MAAAKCSRRHERRPPAAIRSTVLLGCFMLSSVGNARGCKPPMLTKPRRQSETTKPCAHISPMRTGAENLPPIHCRPSPSTPTRQPNTIALLRPSGRSERWLSWYSRRLRVCSPTVWLRRSGGAGKACLHYHTISGRGAYPQRRSRCRLQPVLGGFSAEME
jgi:hypothetical protein